MKVRSGPDVETSPTTNTKTRRSSPAMRLERLTLSGFKSFADATEVRFDTPINGIVGPNGNEIECR